MKKHNPFITANHCVAHRLHLAGSDASNDVPYFKKYEKILRSLYAYFTRSSRRANLLKQMQDINNEPELTILNLCDTRWLSLSNAVGNLYRIIDSVLAALDEDVQNGDKTAQALLEQMDNEFIMATMFLADLTFILKKLINIFQSDYITITHLQPHLDTTINTITSYFIGNNDSAATYGNILQNYIAKENISSEELPSFIYDYSLAMVTSIKNRFPNSSLHFAFQIFDPEELPTNNAQLSQYGNQDIEKLGEFYGKERMVSREKFSPLIDKDELKKEWGLVKFYLQSYKIQEFKFRECWKHVFDTDPTFITNFPNVVKLIQIGLIIPLSNANVERIFSQQKLLKNKLRNKMSLESLHRFLMILINGPELEEMDYESAYEYWFNMKERRFGKFNDNTNM